MPNGDDLQELRAENAKLRDEITELNRALGILRQQVRGEHWLEAELMDTNAGLRKQLTDGNAALFEAGNQAGELHIRLDRMRAENTELHEGLFKLRDQIDRMRAEGGLVVHALDRAIQLIEQLFIFLPEGTVLPSAVATCKHQLDAAMQALHIPKSGGNTSSPASSAPEKMIGSTSSTADSTPTDRPAGSLPASPATTPISPSSSVPPPPGPSPISPSSSDGADRLGNALAIAGQNIVSLNEQRDKITATLTAALLLVESLITQMRLRGIVPDPIVLGAKLKLDQQMRALLGEDHG